MTAYDASQIEVLHGLEPVRRRPGMFLGATEQRARNALAHLLQRPSLLWQLGEGARREALLRRHARLERAGDEYVYEDPVPLPAARHPKCGTRAFELALTSLHGGYVWEGTCGLAILNGASRRLEVETSWRGRCWRARFVRGEVLHPAEDVGAARGEEAGLRLRFELDPAIAGERPDDPVARALAWDRAAEAPGLRLDALGETAYAPNGALDHPVVLAARHRVRAGLGQAEVVLGWTADRREEPQLRLLGREPLGPQLGPPLGRQLGRALLTAIARPFGVEPARAADTLAPGLRLVARSGGSPRDRGSSRDADDARLGVLAEEAAMEWARAFPEDPARRRG